eukprot:3938596-Rhodomonas_salina.4
MNTHALREVKLKVDVPVGSLVDNLWPSATTAVDNPSTQYGNTDPTGMVQSDEALAADYDIPFQHPLSIKICNTLAVVMHSISFISVISIAVAKQKDAVYLLTYTTTEWYGREQIIPSNATVLHDFGNATIVQTLHQNSQLQISVTALIATFFALSAGFQALFTGAMRYIEYAFSASVMIVLLGLQAGEWNAAALFSIFFLSMGCMISGFIAHLLWLKGRAYKDDTFSTKIVVFSSETTIPLWFYPHLLGWVLILAAYIVIWVNFSLTMHTNDNVLSFVLPIIVVESVLFMLFGVTQTLQFIGVLGNKTTKLAFIWQSLVSKSILGWVIFSEVVFVN